VNPYGVGLEDYFKAKFVRKRFERPPLVVGFNSQVVICDDAN